MSIDVRPLLRKCLVICVMVIIDAALGGDFAKSFVAGGLDVLEITLKTPNPLEAFEAIVTAIPKATMDAGAGFLASPGKTSNLAAAPIPILPRCIKTSQAIALRDRGFSALKFFLAEPSGGVVALKALVRPLPDLVFCPIDGIDLSKAPAYLALRHVGTVGGSWVAPHPVFAARDWETFERLVREARTLRS